MGDETVGASVGVNGARIDIETPVYRLQLDTSDGLCGVEWENRLTGRTISLGDGIECEAELDAAKARYWIEGWAIKQSEKSVSDPDEDFGYVAGFHAAEFDDSTWKVSDTLIDEGADTGGRHIWARTNLFLPDSAFGEPLSLMLGGYGLGDYRYMRVFVNGEVAGVRRTSGRWTSPGVFDIGSDSQFRSHVRFGQINTITVQLQDQFLRPKELDDIDPLQNWHMPACSILASPFEQYVVAGTGLKAPRLRVEAVDIDDDSPGEVTVSFSLSTDDQSLSARVVYRASSMEPVLRKETSFMNSGEAPIRLMHAGLGEYETQTSVSDGERGFPVHIGDDRFVCIAHPSGWNIGIALSPGQAWDAGEIVYGVSDGNQTREQFLRHVEGRMRRTVRKHDHPYAIFTAFGSWSIEEDSDRWVLNSEEIVLDSLEKVAKSQEETDCRFDVYTTDFWVDPRGDLTRFAPDRFPDGFDRVREAIQSLGSSPGLWIASSRGSWSIGANPAVAPTRTTNRSYEPHAGAGAFLCRATDPTKSVYRNAFRHHIRENGVRLLKFDNLRSYCSNVEHDHLPGIYSTEAIHEAVISFLNAMDDESPEVFLMLYWGYRSPWWLLHADTLFEPGLAVEAASPAAVPTLYARDGVTLGLDQMQRYCRDVPALGKDSLGVWLSNWWWNSSIGKERWQNAFVMDICRGSMLAQPWSDHDWLTPLERHEIAELIAILRAYPECFRTSRLVVGDPLNNEPYGYSCASGERAFVALNNPTWDDVTVRLKLGAEIGLPDGKEWNLYRRYPSPARLVNGEGSSFSGAISYALRPFEVMLLEVVPSGPKPAPNISLPDQQIEKGFDEPSRTLVMDVETSFDSPHMHLAIEDSDGDGAKAESIPKATVSGTVTVPACSADGVLAIVAQVLDDERPVKRNGPGRYFKAEITHDGRNTEFVEAMGHKTYPCGWQVWRIEIGPSTTERVYEINITAAAETSMHVITKVYLLSI